MYNRGIGVRFEACRAHPMMPRLLSPAVKKPRPKADQSPISSAKVKNTWKYNSAPPIPLLAEINLHLLHRRGYACEDLIIIFQVFKLTPTNSCTYFDKPE